MEKKCAVCASNTAEFIFKASAVFGLQACATFDCRKTIENLAAALNDDDTSCSFCHGNERLSTPPKPLRMLRTCEQCGPRAAQFAETYISATSNGTLPREEQGRRVLMHLLTATLENTLVTIVTLDQQDESQRPIFHTIIRRQQYLLNRQDLWPSSGNAFNQEALTSVQRRHGIPRLVSIQLLNDAKAEVKRVGPETEVLWMLDVYENHLHLPWTRDEHIFVELFVHSKKHRLSGTVAYFKMLMLMEFFIQNGHIFLLLVTDFHRHPIYLDYFVSGNYSELEGRRLLSALRRCLINPIWTLPYATSIRETVLWVTRQFTFDAGSHIEQGALFSSNLLGMNNIVIEMFSKDVSLAQVMMENLRTVDGGALLVREAITFLNNKDFTFVLRHVSELALDPAEYGVDKPDMYDPSTIVLFAMSVGNHENVLSLLADSRAKEFAFVTDEVLTKAMKHAAAATTKIDKEFFEDYLPALRRAMNRQKKMFI